MIAALRYTTTTTNGPAREPSVGLAAPILYTILYSKRWCNGHYSPLTSSRVHCRALQLFEALQFTTALQLYSSTASTLYSTLQSAPTLRHARDV